MKKLWTTAFAFSMIIGLTVSAPASIRQQDQGKTDAALPAKTQVMREYRGIKLGMKSEEVRAIMGKPELVEKNKKERYKIGDGDLFTVYYDAGAVKAIQLYFTDPKRAPTWAEVVGDTEVSQMDNGAKHARRVVSEEKFWVSMYQNKAGTVTTITISR